ncbi:MAG: hypothetical protein M0038_19100 [Pseudomonadota bacterium]|nr:hypothetical protein [Pseudomonadota bacterium]
MALSRIRAAGLSASRADGISWTSSAGRPLVLTGMSAIGMPPCGMPPAVPLCNAVSGKPWLALEPPCSDVDCSCGFMEGDSSGRCTPICTMTQSPPFNSGITGFFVSA